MATETAPLAGSPLWWLERLESRLVARTRRLVVYEAYYRGEHDLKFASKKFREVFGALFSAYAENLCELVVEAVKERLVVQGFRFGSEVDPETGDIPADQEAWRIWQANQLDAWSGIAHRTALVKEQAYLSVWRGADESTPAIRVEDPLHVIVAHEPGSIGVRTAGLKRWWDQDQGLYFATVYLPEAIYKYQQRIRSWANQWGRGSISMGPERPPTERWIERRVASEPWPLPNPLGVVPLVPLVNKPDLSLEGMSEIRSVIPVNDAINKLVADMLLAAEFAAFRQKYGVNIPVEIDEDTGRPIEPFKIAVDRLLTTPVPEPGQPEAKFGEFGATDLAPYVKAIEQRLQMVATITRTPAHYILGSMGTFPSGESLNATEAGLVAKARDKHMFFGEAWEEAMRLGFRVIGDTERASVIDAETIWRDPERRTESQHVDALVKLSSLGIPEEQLWADAGYTPQQIARFKQMRAAQPVPPESPQPPAAPEAPTA